MTDPFDGTWIANRDKSERIEELAGQMALSEMTTLRIENDVHYEATETVHSDGSIYKLEYTTKYNDVMWDPQLVLSAPKGFAPTPELGAFETGKPVCYVMTIKVDDRTQYRITKGLDDMALYVIMRRLDEDGQSFTSTLLGVDGIVHLRTVQDRKT